MTMRRAWIAVLAMALLATPGVAFAHGDDDSRTGEKNRSKACKALRAQMGTDLFRATYGTNRNKRNAHGKCVSKHRPVFKRLVVQAVSECRAQRQAALLRHSKRDDRPQHADRRAFRECVQEKLRALLAEHRAAVKAAVQSCVAERAAGPAAFREKYGKGEHKRRAFFRCVVQTFRANQVAKAA
jgi:hypothetical protein